MEIKDSMLSTWQSKYCKAIKECQKEGKYTGLGEIVVASLTKRTTTSRK